MRYRGLRLFYGFMLCCFLLLQITVFPAFSAVEVETQVSTEAATTGSAGYLIFFRDKPDFSNVKTMNWKDRGEYVMKTLQETAQKSQAGVRAFLDANGVKYQAFWIDNIIAVEKSSLATLNGLLSYSEISSIKARRTVSLHEPTKQSKGAISPTAVEPSISHVKADQVWTSKSITGQGVVVANIDTGARYTHQALVGKYRGNLGGGTFNHDYNWYDPASICGGSPCDNNNHGTHTMGTMVGDDGGSNQIGMAPGAKWIACKGCETNSCSDTSLLGCAQFILAPTDRTGSNADPSKRPNIVNNSWGGGGGDNWYQTSVNNWQAAGIYPVFSNGNSGPSCGTVGSPGDYPNVTAVGAIDYTTDQPASFSSRGPSTFPDVTNPLGYPYLKPQVSAPGVNIRSSVGTGDSDYQGGWDGTSMAAPHVAGLLALMLEACPDMVGEYSSLETTLIQTVAPIAYATACGGEGPGSVPNQATGWGLIDSLAAVNAILAACGPSGTLAGTVTTGATAVAGATVSAGSYTATTAADGTYTISSVPVGSYNMTVTKYGYADGSAAGVAVTANTTTTQNFSLTALTPVAVTGTVKDASGQSWPLYATVTVTTGGNTQTVVTDMVTGQYTVQLMPGYTYTFTASSTGYNDASRSVAIAGTATVDLGLTVTGACTAPGYALSAQTENFDGITAPAIPAGWAVADVSGTTGDWTTTTSSSHPAGQSPISAPNMARFNSYNASSGNSTRLYQTSGANFTTGSAYGLNFWMYHDNNYTAEDYVQIQVSVDGGTSWANVDSPIYRYTGANGWAQHSVDLSAYIGQSDVRLALLGYSSYGNDIYIDNVRTGSCNPLSGGLVAGTVKDANTSHLLAGATVSGASDQTTTDSSGVFALFSSVGTQTIEVTGPIGYGSGTANVNVSSGLVVRQDFSLGAGVLAATPTSITVTLAANQSTTRQLLIGNAGTLAANVKLREHSYSTVLAPPASSLYALSSAAGSDPSDGAPVNGTDRMKVEATGTGAVLPTGVRYRSAGVSCDGSGYYVFGGWGATVLNESWHYDSVGNIWTRMADMPYALTNIQAACIDNLIYVVGGYDGSVYLNSFLIYNTTYNTWTSSTWPKAAGPSVAAANGKVYAFGGNPGPSSDTYVFNPGTGVWTQKASMPAGRSWASAVTVGDYIYLIGGMLDGSVISNAVTRYNTVTDTWSSAGPQLSNVRMSPLSIWYGDYLYVMGGGGRDGSMWNAQTTTEVYKPSLWPSGSWSTDSENIPSPGVGMAGDCSSSKVWGAGGEDGGSYYDINRYLQKTSYACHVLTDIPWLSENPVESTVPAGGSRSVTVTLNTSGLAIGTYTAGLKVVNDTPYDVPLIPVTLIVTGTPKNLTVMKSGTGTGTVTSDPTGINCGTKCMAPFGGGTVTLTATPAVGSSFVSWSGCTSVSKNICTVSLTTSNRTVTASFVRNPSRTLTVTKTGTGSGTVTSTPQGISCGTKCSSTFTANPVTLTAVAAAGSTFTSWSGCTSVSGATCTVSMTSNKSVSARFTK